MNRATMTFLRQVGPYGLAVPGIQLTIDEDASMRRCLATIVTQNQNQKWKSKLSSYIQVTCKHISTTDCGKCKQEKETLGQCCGRTESFAKPDNDNITNKKRR